MTLAKGFAGKARKVLLRAAAVVLATAAITAGSQLQPAEAAEWRWSSAICTNRTTDMRMTVCTQVVYLRYSDGTVWPRHVYAWWSPSEAAYNLDRVQVAGPSGPHRIWYWIGMNLPAYWLSDPLPLPRSYDRNCWVYFDIDGWMWFDAPGNYHYHLCA